MLGSQVMFSYCRVERRDRPCRKALACWSVHFDVESHFRELLTEEEFDECFLAAPQSKVGTLIELIERAREITRDRKKE
jgi:hypothetical protein